jgi:hypothetical protein
MDESLLRRHIMLASVKDGVEVRAGVAAIGNARLKIIQKKVVGIFNFIFIGVAVPGFIKIIAGLNLRIVGGTLDTS